MFNKAETVNLNAMKVGVKRKANMTESHLSIPSKRVSPFLETPNERKDERKKVLLISVKKLKHLDEAKDFLRRTVLVNNVRKRLQMEFREENLRTNTYETYCRKTFSGFGVFNRNCISNSCLFDDPTFSCFQEKITDDMTDTLIQNVFDDQSNAMIPSSDIGEKLDQVPDEIEISTADLGLLTSFR